MSLRSMLPALLLSFGLAAPAAAQQGKTAEKKTKPVQREWVVFYYMAYDNNLEKCGRPIVDMIKAGITNDKVAAVVSADFTDTEGMKRYVLTQGKERETPLATDASSDEATVAAELKWLGENMPAKKYALIFLNHGGGLGQMSLDERPGKPGAKRWLYPPKLAKEVAAWRKKVQQAKGEVELFFYQQCGKGSLENYHVMQDAARWIMGSQTVVGAPNYYYTKTLQALCAKPTWTGLDLAKEITRRDPPHMFTTYTTVDAAAVKKLPKKLDAVLKPLLGLKRVKFPRLNRQAFWPCFNFGRREVFFDGLALLKAFYVTNGLDLKPFTTFKTWSDSKLVVNHRVSPRKTEKASSWCGYSVFLPLRPRALSRYADFPIYQQTKLDELFKKLLSQRRALPAGKKKKKPSRSY